MKDKLLKLINKVGLCGSLQYKGETYRLEEEGLCQWVKLANGCKLELKVKLANIDLRCVKAS